MLRNDEIDFENRIVAPEYSMADNETELSLRPKILNDYIGQKKVKEKILYSFALNHSNFQSLFIS